jgi:hypothetical protein
LRFKRKEEGSKRQKEVIEKQLKDEAEEARRRDAESKYREWLRDNYSKLQESKRLEREARQRNRQREQEEAAHAEQRRKLAENTFLAWVNNKQSQPISKE